jgi:hypothetical protein
MKTAYEATNSIEAYILKGLLETYEIAAFVQGEHLHSGAGELPINGFIKVVVNDADFARAREILTEWEASAALIDNAFPLDTNAL